ncbi:MAG: hypothetical protein DRR42_10630, partial [Gammaproteobacteria bacterium]
MVETMIKMLKQLFLVCLFFCVVWFNSDSQAFESETEILVTGIVIDLDTRPDLPGYQYDMTTVKDIPSRVINLVGFPGNLVVPNFSPGALLKAEIRGPAYGQEVVTVSTRPNQPFEFQPFRAPGEYTISNVRLEDDDGNIILERDATLPPVTITVIDQIIVSQVVTRPLTLDEINNLGIVIDEDNFQILNFAFALTLESDPVAIDLPVMVPIGFNGVSGVQQPESLRSFAAREFKKLSIPNMSIQGFTLAPPPEAEPNEIVLPQISGVIIIPGDIAYLNQFFSVYLQTSNLGPEGSGLNVINAKAKIVLPVGDDEIAETGDDPLRMAETEIGGIQTELPLADESGVDIIQPQGTNSAQFLVEGLREGTHKVNFEITGDLEVPSLDEPVPLSGGAVGVLEVKNPTFDLVLSHPDVVREGEPYSMFVTVTNTSTSPANLFSLSLNTRSLTGTRLRDGESETRTIETLAARQSETFEYKLVARTTGKVGGTVFLADEGINGSFILTTGVGDTGIPLSPSTLLLPNTTRYLPSSPDLVFAAVRMLGQAYSAAVAPYGSLPGDIKRMSEEFVFTKGANLAMSGIHTAFGQSHARTAIDTVMDYFGSDYLRTAEIIEEDPDDPLEAARLRDDIEAFDILRRKSDAGHNLTDVLGQLLLPNIQDVGLSAFLLNWAEIYASKPAHLSFGISSQGPPVAIAIVDQLGNVTGANSPSSEIRREIGFGDIFDLSSGSTSDVFGLVAAAQSDSYTLQFLSPESTDLEITAVIPENGVMIHIVYPSIAVSAGARGSIEVSGDGSGGYTLELDGDGDGIVEQSITPLSVTTVEDKPPGIIAVRQWGKGENPLYAPPFPQWQFEVGDALGRLVGVLFDEEVEEDSAQTWANYLVEGNYVDQLELQAGRRLVFIAVDSPIGPFIDRSITVAGVNDFRGNASLDSTRTIIPDPGLGRGATFNGQVLQAGGSPLPFARIEYLQPVLVCSLKGCFVKVLGISTLTADASGRFALDFLLKDQYGKYTIQAVDPETGEIGKISGEVQYDGQPLNLSIIMPGFASLSGQVLSQDGIPAVGGEPGTPESFIVTAQNVSTGEKFSTWVDAEGRYQFPDSGVRPDGETARARQVTVGNLILQTVRPSDGHTAVTAVNISSAGTENNQDLVLIPPTEFGTVAGRVLEFDGVTPASEVPVQVAGEVFVDQGLYSQQFELGVVGVATTDSEGFYQIDLVPTGNIEVRAIREYTYEEARAKSFLQAQETKFVNLVLPGQGGTVRGIVRDALGNIVPYAQVAAGPSLITADENGYFEISGLPRGEVIVYGQGPDSLALATQKVETLNIDDVQDIVLTLQPVGNVTGTAYEADGVTPVSGQKIQLWVNRPFEFEGRQGAKIGETYTDADGRYRFDNFPIEDYSVRAVRQGDFDGGFSATSIRFAGDERVADIVFRGLGKITGRAIQSNGTPAITDIVITRKVFKVVKLSDSGIPNPYLEYVNELAGLGGEIGEAVQQAIAQSPEFDYLNQEYFILEDETSIIKSNILGP